MARMADLPEPSSQDGPAGSAGVTLLRIKCQRVINQISPPSMWRSGCKRQIEGWKYVIPGGEEEKVSPRL